MEPVIKRDWEIVRIFLILALLTVGFVWGVQSLLLAPAPSVRLHSSASHAGDSHQKLSDLGILLETAELPAAPQPAAPLRKPADSGD